MAFAAENSAEQSRFIKPRSRNRNQPITPPNPRPRAPLPKPTSSTLFSSIFSSSSSTTPTNTHNASSPSGLTSKMNKLTSMAFNRLGCGGLSPVTLPDVIQSAADWEAKKARKQKRKKKKKKKRSSSVQALKKTANNGNGTSSPVAVEVVSDVFCAPPGIGFSSDAAFVDCVEPRRPINTRRKHKKHSGTARRDRFRVLDSDAFNATPYHLLPQYFPRENMMSRGRIAIEGVFDGYDQFGELRLDVDNMTYEELVDLSDKIGYVGTGLREEKIFHCLRKARLESTPLLPPIKCSICQDEYEANDEVGKLDCGHCYHIGCIKPWLLQKNSCPICKAAAHST